MKSLTDIRTQMGVSDPAEDSRARVRQQQADILSALQTGNNVGDTLLATGMMGQVQGFENVRRGLAGLNPAFRSEAEVLDDALKGIDTTTTAGQRQALEIVRRISPGKAMALATEFDARNKAILDNMPRYQVGSETYANGVRVDNTDQGQIIVRQNGRVITDPAEAAQLQREGEEANLQRTAREARIAAQAPIFMESMEDYRIQIDGIVNTVDSLERVKEKYEQGAAVGVAAMLPEIFQNNATRELNKIVTEMGLGVIANGKFGALSEQEMKVAMEANVPQDIQFGTQEEAIEYLIGAIAAKKQLATELSLYRDYLIEQNDAGAPASKVEWQKIRDEQIRAQEINQGGANPTPNANEKLSTEDALRALQDLDLQTGA